jgi:hypothetical protein
MIESELPVDDVEKSDIALALGPLWAIDKRLAFHSHPDHKDRILSGLRYDREGKITNYGVADLPFVSVFDYVENEGYASGHPGTAGPFIKYNATLYLRIAAKMDYGLMMRDPRATGDSRYVGVGALEWVQRVKDAIELTAEDPPFMDWALERTVQRPCQFRMQAAEISQLAWVYVLEVDINIEQIPRASRSPEAGFIFNSVASNPLSM